MKLTNAVVFLLALIIYAPSRHCGVVFDDPMAIAENPDVIDTSMQRWLQLWKDDFWGREMWSENSHTSYRPLTIISYRLEVLIQGKVDAANMHIVNVLIHAYVSSLVVTVARMILSPSNEQAPFVAGILFAVHPVHVEAVTGLVGRAELLCACLMLHAYIAMHYGKFLRTLLLVTAACLCKETGITFHGIVFAHITVGFVCRLREARGDSPGIRSIVRSSVLRLGLSVVHAVAYLGIRAWLIHDADDVEMDGGQAEIEFGLDSSELVRKTENPYQALEPGVNKALSLQVVFVENARLLLFPHALSAEYSFNCIPMVESMFDVRLVFAVILWLAGVLSAIVALRDLLLRNDSRLALALAWLVLPFLPASHIFVKIGTLVAERLLYIPSVGFCLFVAHILTLPGRKSLKWIQPLLVVAVAWMTMRTCARIPEWKTVESLFKAAYETCPQSAKINQQMAKIAMGRGELDEAREYLDKAREIHPDWCDLDFQYGTLAVYEGDQEEVIDRYIKSLPCIYTNKGAHRALTELFMRRKEELEVSGQSQANLQYDIGRMHETLLFLDVALDNYKEAAFAAKDSGQSELAMKIALRALDLIESLEVNLGEFDRGFKPQLPVDVYQCLFTFIEAWCKEATEPLLAVELYQAAMSCRETRNGAISGAAVVLQKRIHSNDGEPKDELYRTYGDVLARVVDPEYNSKDASNRQTLTEVEIQYIEAAINSYEHYLINAKDPARETVVRKVNALRQILSISSASS